MVKIKTLIKTKSKISRFLLTINTNQSDILLVDELRDVMNSIFESIDLFLKININGKWIVYKTYLDEGNPPLIDLDETEIESNVELGKKLGKVHSHTLITIPHTTKVQLDRTQLDKFVTSSLDLSGIHVNIQYIRDPFFSISNYIKKDLS